MLVAPVEGFSKVFEGFKYQDSQAGSSIPSLLESSSQNLQEVSSVLESDSQDFARREDLALTLVSQDLAGMENLFHLIE